MEYVIVNHYSTHIIICVCGLVLPWFIYNDLRKVPKQHKLEKVSLPIVPKSMSNNNQYLVKRFRIYNVTAYAMVELVAFSCILAYVDCEISRYVYVSEAIDLF